MRTELIRVDDIGASQGEAMITLFNEHFESVSREQFQEDLNEKGWTVLITSDEGELCGFTTLDIYDVNVGEKTVSVVFSGDTIVDQSARGSFVLSSGWIGSVNYLRRELGKDRLWWLLIVSGYRTYRFLPTFWNKLWPCHSEPTPAYEQSLMCALAEDRFGEAFDSNCGIVHPGHPQVLRAGLRGIPESRMCNPYVAFFAERNPGHARGDELVCLTELAEENLTRAGRRMWDAGEKLFAAQGALP